MSDKLKVVNFYRSNGDRSSDLGEFTDGMTRQEFAEECDINVIMAQYERTGVISHVAEREPIYYDFTAVPDLMTAMSVMQDAETAFMSLPAKVRRDFDNDPLKFVDFASNPDNLDEMRKYGLAPPAPKEPLEAAPLVPATPDKGGAVKPPGEAPKPE